MAARGDIRPAPGLGSVLCAKKSPREVRSWFALPSHQCRISSEPTPRERLQEMLPAWLSPGTAEWLPVP